MTHEEPCKTSLYELHEQAGGKIVDFHGWLLPVQYTSIIQEHMHVRTKVGMFDVSHMAEFMVEGAKAAEWLEKIVCNSVGTMSDYQCIYTPMCYENGTIVDDLLIYRFSPVKYMAVVNAANEHKDFAWMQKNLIPGVDFRNISSATSQIALQGPLAIQVLERIFGRELSSVRTYRFCEFDYKSSHVILSRTGYTGEDGFEIYVDHELARGLFAALLKEPEVAPCGLGCRDTLRFEARLPLYGNELSDQVTPIDTGLKRFCDLNGPDFIGKNVLLEQVESKNHKCLIGIEMVDKGVARTGYEVFDQVEGGNLIGTVTSGSPCPSLDKTCALVLAGKKGKIGDDVFVDIRGKRKKAKIVKTPFYSRS